MKPIVWLDPRECDPPHRISHPEKVEHLITEFQKGWGIGYPALVGYFLNGKVQLLSGTHRQAAAVFVGIKIPCIVYSTHDVEQAWGDLPLWAKLMDAPIVERSKEKKGE